ncbi:MAG: hemin uptake protein HemP [Pirellulaceae bacterium]|nr:hemin uptake protein HemP [Pirellulaceae bacterium]
MTEPLPTKAPSPSSPPAPACGQPEGREAWSSEELLGDKSEILIRHGGETYRLRRTRQDKLILYK